MIQTREQRLKTYRLSLEEYHNICKLLGRDPEGIEWALFSALWSEHCSYKSSRVHLKKFAKTLNAKVVTSQGENAGVLDLGFDEKVVFKMESHNHPSFIEPYQGAATGVGGILRDIFTMGARPIVLADYLCFGRPEAPRMRGLIDGVVRGISGYGNCVGVPTLTGQTNFDESYDNNILVNAMAVGFVGPNEKIALSKAAGPGNWVVYVGAKTGRDGVHGAAMASESFDENSEAKRPNVQIGDPYFEKLLIESCLEVIQRDLVVAIQDMGAAGLTSSSFEMASKGQVGMKLDLSLIPLRDPTMGPEEILLSESQERMLLVCQPSRFSDIESVFRRWGLDATVVGEVLEQRVVELWWKGEKVTSIDPDLLTENAPVYLRPYDSWVPQNQREKLSLSRNTAHLNIANELQKPTETAKKWIYSQYDQRVQARTVRGAEYDVAFHRLPSGRGLAVTLGCRPHWMKRDARIGAMDAVLYPSLQMGIKGAQPVGLTDCLNFGNPEKKNVMSEFVVSVEMIAELCQKMDIPVISGNVSFYNETLGKNIISTPATGLVGVRGEVENIPEDRFKSSGSEIWLLRTIDVRAESGSDQFVGDLDLPKWADLVIKTAGVVEAHPQLIASQVVGAGGLLLTLAKMSLGGLSAMIDADLSVEEMTQDLLYQWVIEVPRGESSRLISDLQKLGWSAMKIGVVGASALRWKSHSWDLEEMRDAYFKGFGGLLAELS